MDLKFHHGRISVLTPDHFAWKKNISTITFPVATPTTAIRLHTGPDPHGHIHILKFPKCLFRWSHTVLKVAARSPYSKIMVLKIQKGRQGRVRADWHSAKCWALIRSRVKMTLLALLLTPGASALESMQRFRHSKRLEGQQGMLLIGIKGSDRTG